MGAYGNSIEKISNTFIALRHKNFRYFWMGQFISQMGTWMQRTAQVWLVYQLTKSPLMLGILGVFQFGPVLAFSLFAGVFVDRYPKKRIMVIAQIVFMIQAIVMALLVWSGDIMYWHILALSLVFGFTQTIDMPARLSYFIELVGKDDLMNAISLNSTAVNLAKIIGPAVAGIVMAKFGAAFCFFLNAVSFIPILWALSKIKTKEQVLHKEKGNMLQSIREGLMYINKNNMLKTTIKMLAIVSIFSMNFDVIIPVVTESVLGKGPREYSFLLSAVGIGAFAGALVMVGRSKRGIKSTIIFWAAILLALTQIIVSFSSSYILYIFLVAGMGFIYLIFLNMCNSTLQLNSNDKYRGRVMSIYSLFTSGSAPIGNFFAGTVMEYMGADKGFLACGIATFVFTLLLIVNKLIFKSKQMSCGADCYEVK